MFPFKHVLCMCSSCRADVPCIRCCYWQNCTITILQTPLCLPTTGHRAWARQVPIRLSFRLPILPCCLKINSILTSRWKTHLSHVILCLSTINWDSSCDLFKRVNHFALLLLLFIFHTDMVLPCCRLLPSFKGSRAHTWYMIGWAVQTGGGALRWTMSLKRNQKHMFTVFFEMGKSRGFRTGQSKCALKLYGTEEVNTNLTSLNNNVTIQAISL